MSLGTAYAGLAMMGCRDFMNTHGKRSFQGNIYGANFKRGHRLFKMDFPEASVVEDVNVAIVGSGVSGLSCAYHLSSQNISGIKLFELEDHLGGKSSSLGNKAPWGAHYLPLVNKEYKELISFLKEINAITRINNDGTVEYNPLMVCSAPTEKLFYYGRLQDGLTPASNLSQRDKNQFDQFFKLMENYKFQKGSDGRYAFDIPMEKSSKDSKYTELDNLTMAEFVLTLGMNSEKLHWYINYCCRDDYGTSSEETSAWAGIHYFASRRGKGKDLSEGSVLTWPEGNSFLVNKLRELSSVDFVTGRMLYKIEGHALYFYDFSSNQSIKVQAKQVVLAIPQFILSKILNQDTDFNYAPWMVANLQIKWDEYLEKSLAWDNVNYHGQGIGFVSANHQLLASHKKENYLTYYWPLSHLPPKEARKLALSRTHESWCQDIMKEIGPMIPDIKERLLRVDIWPWGHGMVRPTRNFIFKDRLNAKDSLNDFTHVAHTDLSGLSLFEEGFYRGLVAAKKVVQGLG